MKKLRLHISRLLLLLAMLVTSSAAWADIASGFNPVTGEMLMTRVQTVPAGEGLLLKGTAGQNYEVPTTTTDIYYSNLLKAVTKAISVAPTADGKTNYVLADDGDEMYFGALKQRTTLDANTAYVSIPTAVAGTVSEVKMMFDNSGMPTGIAGREGNGAKASMWYMPDGRRVSKPSRGLYIVNGKKVVVTSRSSGM